MEDVRSERQPSWYVQRGSNSPDWPMSTVFDISFDDAARELPPHIGPGHVWAAVRIDDFREEIVIPTHYWRQVDYYRQWYSACQRLLLGHRATVFLTDVRGGWSSMRFSFSWAAYRAEDLVYIRNVMLWPERFQSLGFESAHLALPQRTTRSGKRGTRKIPISEWTTRLKSISEFAGRLRGRPPNG